MRFEKTNLGSVFNPCCYRAQMRSAISLLGYIYMRLGEARNGDLFEVISKRLFAMTGKI